MQNFCVAKVLISPYVVSVKFLVFNIALHKEYLKYQTEHFQRKVIVLCPSIFRSGILVTGLGDEVLMLMRKKVNEDSPIIYIMVFTLPKHICI